MPKSSDIAAATPVIGVVANEPSGDILGASLVRELKALIPSARFVGVAGPHMLEAGCETLVPMERLSVMGLTEVLAHLPELLRLRRQIFRQLLAIRPAVMVGVDAPDFNLGLERRLRDRGIRTAHLVSPTVWAWRPGRVRTIRRSVDLMLSIFPFEEDFLRQHGVPARYVGHPLADEIPLDNALEAARNGLGLAADGEWLAILPGSRASEVRALAGPFLAAARLCLAARPGLRLVVPLVNEGIAKLFDEIRAEEAPDLPVERVAKRSREVIAASDCVLTASGTATLETLLVGRPMVVAYRLNPLTYQLVKRLDLVKVPYIAMANLLADEGLAPEFIQDDVRPDRLAAAVIGLLDDPQRASAIRARYRAIHQELRCNAARTAAGAVLDLADLAAVRP